MKKITLTLLCATMIFSGIKAMDGEASDDGVLIHDETTLLLPHKPKINWASIGKNTIALTAYGYVLSTFFGMAALKDCTQLDESECYKIGFAAGITGGLAIAERIIPISNKIYAWQMARRTYYHRLNQAQEN